MVESNGGATHSIFLHIFSVKEKRKNFGKNS